MLKSFCYSFVCAATLTLTFANRVWAECAGRALSPKATCGQFTTQSACDGTGGCYWRIPLTIGTPTPEEAKPIQLLPPPPQPRAQRTQRPQPKPPADMHEIEEDVTTDINSKTGQREALPQWRVDDKTLTKCLNTLSLKQGRLGRPLDTHGNCEETLKAVEEEIRTGKPKPPSAPTAPPPEAAATS